VLLWRPFLFLTLQVQQLTLSNIYRYKPNLTRHINNNSWHAVHCTSAPPIQPSDYVTGQKIYTTVYDILILVICQRSCPTRCTGVISTGTLTSRSAVLMYHDYKHPQQSAISYFTLTWHTDIESLNYCGVKYWLTLQAGIYSRHFEIHTSCDGLKLLLLSCTLRTWNVVFHTEGGTCSGGVRKRVLRKIYGPKRDDGSEEDFKMRSLVICAALY
jgi:hypothetical protein